MPKTFLEKTKGILRFFGWEAFQAWVLPSLSVPVAVVIGWLSSAPWFLVYLGALFAFAMTATGLLRFSEWRFKVTAHHKLSFSKILLQKVVSDEGQMHSIKFGFYLYNAASFPIEYIIQEIRTDLDGEYSPNKEHEKDAYVIPAFAFGWFYNHAIPLRLDHPTGKFVEGGLHAKLKYGRPQNPVCE